MSAQKDRLFYVIGLVALLVLIYWFYTRGSYPRMVDILDAGKNLGGTGAGSVTPGDISFYYPGVTSRTKYIDMDRYIHDAKTAEDYYQQSKCGCS